MSCLLTAYSFNDQFFLFEMSKRIERLEITFIVLIPSWSNIKIFQSISNIVVFSFPKWSLTCLVSIYGYNSKNLIKEYQNVGFLFNLKQILRSSTKAFGIYKLYLILEGHGSYNQGSHLNTLIIEPIFNFLFL